VKTKPPTRTTILPSASPVEGTHGLNSANSKQSK
jgi:hypothetical protein